MHQRWDSNRDERDAQETRGCHLDSIPACERCCNLPTRTYAWGVVVVESEDGRGGTTRARGRECRPDEPVGLAGLPRLSALLGAWAAAGRVPEHAGCAHLLRGVRSVRVGVAAGRDGHVPGGAHHPVRPAGRRACGLDGPQEAAGLYAGGEPGIHGVAGRLGFLGSRAGMAPMAPRELLVGGQRRGAPGAASVPASDGAEKPHHECHQRGSDR